MLLTLIQKHHRVIFYRERFRLIPKQDECTRHPGMVYKRYCELCGSKVIFFTRDVFSWKIARLILKTIQTEKSRCQSNILTKAGRLNCCIGYAIGFLSKKRKCKLFHELLRKQMKMKRHLAYLQHYEHIYICTNSQQQILCNVSA